MPKALVSVRRSADALRRLHVTRDALASAPEITPLLKQADGGLKQVMRAMRMAINNNLIEAYLKKYDSIPGGDRDRLPMEAIALAAGVDIGAFLGAVMLALQAQAMNAVKIIAVTSHPKITKARIKFGQLPFGERDRTALDTTMGILPSPKGPTFIGKAIFQSGKGQDDDQTEEGEIIDGDEPDVDKVFPPANAMQERLTPIRQKLLPEPARN